MPNLPIGTPLAVPAAASSVVLLHDAPERGLAVFMLKRPPASSFAAEALVFPGGLVDDDDGSPQMLALAPGLDPVEAARRLGMDKDDAGDQGAAHHVAAVRELFEETGILVGRLADGTDASTPDGGALDQARADLLSGSPFWEVLSANGLVIVPEELVYAARFVTPEGSPKRFDARFFLLPAPIGQVVSIHSAEATEGGWHRPADVLERYHGDRVTLLPPTRAMCVELARHPDTTTALTRFRKGT